MLPDSWPSDYDYAEAHGNHDTSEREPSPDDAPLGETGREILSPAEMAAELRRICGPVLDRIRGAEQSAHRCPHQINLERARCATCAPLSLMELGR